MNSVLQKSCVIAAITCGLCIAPSALAFASEATPPQQISKQELRSQKQDSIVWTKNDFYLDEHDDTKIVDRRSTDGTAPGGLLASGIEKLKKSGGKLVIPEGITEIDGQAFSNSSKRYDGLIKSVTFPSTLKKIGYAAFWWNSISGEVTIPEGVTDIDAVAFRENNISSVTLPSTLKTIGSQAFGWNKITKIVDNGDLSKLDLKKYWSILPKNMQDIQHATPFVAQHLPDVVLVPDKDNPQKTTSRPVQYHFTNVVAKNNEDTSKPTYFDIYNADDGEALFLNSIGTLDKKNNTFTFVNTKDGKVWSLFYYKNQNGDSQMWGDKGFVLGDASFLIRGAKEFNVTYSFVNGTDAKQALPKSVTKLLPTATKAYESTSVNANKLSITTVKDKDAQGTWTFTGWNTSNVSHISSDVTFVGTWTFKKDPTPQPPTPPTPHHKPGQPTDNQNDQQQDNHKQGDQNQNNIKDNNKHITPQTSDAGAAPQVVGSLSVLGFLTSLCGLKKHSKPRK
jgi:hypothetical protein